MILLVSACAAAPTASPSAIREEVTEAILITPSPEATVEDTPVSRGAAIFVQTRGDYACATCHYRSSGRLVGPGLANLAERFEGYGLEGTVEEYIRTSITNPPVFIAPGEPAYPSSIMPLTYSALLSEDEISDLIAYILSL
jgi:cytochrome c553